jgi:uncharacterized OsmC-like protein
MRKTNLRAFAPAGLLIAGVGACSTPTLYQAEIAGGYSKSRTG